MKPIKLLTLTSLGYLFIFTLLLAVTFTIFFEFLHVGVDESIDEILINRQKDIISLLHESKGEVPKSLSPFADYNVYQLEAGQKEYEAYNDTLIYDQNDRENYVYRKLSSVKQVNGRYYKIDVFLPLIEEEDVIYSIFKALVLVFVIVLIMFFLSSRFLSKQIFTPFYTTLLRLKDFEVHRAASYVPVSSNIREFKDLNNSLVELTSKAHEAFSNQKKFIENASHELLTPIAVSQNKLEELAGNADLTDKQSQIVQVLMNVNQRMSRLNKTLLLLSKIENGQFPETQNIMLRPLIEEIITLFEEQKANMQLYVAILVPEDTFVTGNFVLLELLLTNLIKNAFVHNYAGGDVIIDYSNNQLGVSNTSAGNEIPKDNLYQRFYKNSSRKESWGLGLAIVRNICTVQHWDIRYYYIATRHVFQLSFYEKE